MKGLLLFITILISTLLLSISFNLLLGQSLYNAVMNVINPVQIMSHLELILYVLLLLVYLLQLIVQFYLRKRD